MAIIQKANTELEAARNSLNGLIMDVNKACLSIKVSSLSIKDRIDIKTMLAKANAMLNDSKTTSKALYAEYNKILKSIPYVLKQELNVITMLNQNIYRINNDPSIFDACKKERKELAPAEYEKIFKDKFNEAYKKLHSTSLDADFDDGDIQAEYLLWLGRQKEALALYEEFIKACKVSPNNESSHPIELFKGSYDSLKPYFRKNLEVYSKYATTINSETYRRGVHAVSDITIRNGVPCYIIERYNGQRIYLPVDSYRYYTYFVHNPYDKEEERKIQKLLENDNLEITYGLFGSPKEEDIGKKISELRKLKDELPNTRFYEIYKDEGIYGEIHIAVLRKSPKKETN